MRAAVLASVLVIGVVAVAALVFLPPSGPEVSVTGNCEQTIELTNGTYCVIEVDVPLCHGAVGSSTPYVNVELGNLEFRMRIEDCFAPFGLTLNGTSHGGGGEDWHFLLTSHHTRDAEGWVSDYSPDGQAGVHWDGAYHVQLLSRRDEVSH
jgi:hypothetical protein